MKCCTDPRNNKFVKTLQIQETLGFAPVTSRNVKLPKTGYLAVSGQDPLSVQTNDRKYKEKKNNTFCT